MRAGVTLTMGSGQDTIKDADTTLHWRPGVNWFLSVVGLYQWSPCQMGTTMCGEHCTLDKIDYLEVVRKKVYGITPTTLLLSLSQLASKFDV